MLDDITSVYFSYTVDIEYGVHIDELINWCKEMYAPGSWKINVVNKVSGPPFQYRFSSKNENDAFLCRMTWDD